MNLTSQFKNFTLLGAEWVLWLLVILSVFSIGVMIERFIFFLQRNVDGEQLANDAVKAVRAGDEAEFSKKYADSEAMAARVAMAGIKQRDDGVDSVSEAMNSEKAKARMSHERYLVVLGTLGNNAPFIGLFGTVLGVIKAFEDLRQNAAGGAAVVHGGISEALVATAIGLLVALPAVVAFNYFNRRVRQATTTTDEVAHALLGALYAAEEAQSKSARQNEDN